MNMQDIIQQKLKESFSCIIIKSFNIEIITYPDAVKPWIIMQYQGDLLFGSNHKVEYVQFWGGPHGGATPDYQGQGLATNFLLYDGATGFSGVTSSGALYYPVAMEQSSLACMEIAATGAKAVAKLVAERVGLLERRIEEEVRDEL